jgi:hypothetical protein
MSPEKYSLPETNAMATRLPKSARHVAIIPNDQPTCKYRIIALDPTIKDRDGKVLTAVIEIPNEQLMPGPRGYRVQVVDYDATNRVLYKAAPYRGQDLEKKVAHPETDRAFHARSAYAIVMSVLARFERALGRRVPWSFAGHQITIAPHAFLDLNAFYSQSDRAIFFGYYPDTQGMVFTCLSHDVVAHETTHALVDGLRPGYLRPSSADQAAFHEAFGDIVALLSVLSLREIVSVGLDRGKSLSKELVDANDVTVDALKNSLLLGLADQVGQAMYGVRGMSLRRSINIAPSPALKDTDEYQEGHRRGELLVAAVLGTFLKVWRCRIVLYGNLERGKVSRVGVVDAAIETAEHLLNMCIRALDYCPLTDLVFGDFLSAMLTADFEMHRDDSRYGYRKSLIAGFQSFGFEPAATSRNQAEPGLWGPPGENEKGNKGLIYNRTHFESMQHDKDEVFRFLWENRDALKVETRAYTNVGSVDPCYRVSSDGFLLHETVAAYSQQVRLRASDLDQFGLKKPRGMPGDQDLTIYGGGALIFDEAGRLKYHVRNRIGTQARQNQRLEYLWKTGAFNTKMSFSAMHLESILRGQPTLEADSEDDDNGG